MLISLLVGIDIIHSCVLPARKNGFHVQRTPISEARENFYHFFFFFIKSSPLTATEGITFFLCIEGMRRQEKTTQKSTDEVFKLLVDDVIISYNNFSTIISNQQFLRIHRRKVTTRTTRFLRERNAWLIINVSINYWQLFRKKRSKNRRRLQPRFTILPPRKSNTFFFFSLTLGVHSRVSLAIFTSRLLLMLVKTCFFSARKELNLSIERD